MTGWISEECRLPSGPGAYALVIRLRRRLRAWPDQGPVLAPGLYLYAGSAKGPGGIRARVLRHARRGKPRHWHVDRLTGNARIVAVATIVGGKECNIVAATSAVVRIAAPAPGFGSTDCRICRAHLLALPPAIRHAELAAMLPGAVWWPDPAGGEL